ncbi:MAG: 6,7-dimethyl-8-ribityllumazine synthase [Gammaproteobacteria bacterium]|nr:6,7-dimethyl-8-ribityllumazine synthase [Gammaproteobacteria bacterium]
MNNIHAIAGDLRAEGLRFSILATRFNAFIVDRLVDGAADTLKRHGAKDSDIEIIYIPGAYELPLTAKVVARRKKSDAIIALGCVIRGATPHFDYVAGECSKGLASVSLEFDIPVAFGVLTTETIEQAIERAGTKAGNKGVDAAMSAMEMANLLRQLSD